MNSYGKYSPCCYAAALTLIEVLAATAILGVLLVGVVLAKSRHRRQIYLTERRNVAIAAADEMLGRWWLSSGGPPVSASGTLESDPSISWQTAIVANTEMQKLDIRVLRLELRDTESQRLSDDSSNEPLLAVEIALPDKPAEDAGEGAAK